MTLTELKPQISALYRGRSASSIRFRYMLLGLDLATLAFLIFSSFFYGHWTTEIMEFLFGLYILTEFLARLSIAPHKPSFLLRPNSLIDMVVILSFIVPLTGQHLAFLRALSLLRLLRSYTILNRLRQDFAFFRHNEDMLLSATNLLLFIFVMTELVFQSQVGKNAEIQNFVDAMYFTVTTLTTTGFGDITLKGMFGRTLSIIIMIFGVSLFLRLIQTMFRPNKVRHVCPSCGLFLHERDAIHCKHCGHILNIPNEGDS